MAAVINPNAISGSNLPNSTSFVVTMPGHSPGDVIYIAITEDSAVAEFTQASFTKLYDDVVVGQATFALFYKTAGDSEPATYTVTSTVSERAAWMAWSVAGDGGINAQATNTLGLSTTASTANITTTEDGCLDIIVIATELVTTPMGASSTHNKLDEISVASGASLGVYYKTLVSAGLATAGNVTLNASQDWLTVRFAITPGSFVPPVAPSALPSNQRIRTYLP